MDQIWHRSEIVYSELLKTARRMIAREVRRNFVPIERYGDTLDSLSMDVVVATIDMLIELERVQGKSTNLLGRAYRVMNNMIRNEAKTLWRRPKTVQPGANPNDENPSLIVHEVDQNLEAVVDRVTLEKLKRLVYSELPSLYERARDDAFRETGQSLYNHADFLDCAHSRLAGKTARTAWKHFSGIKGGSWQNMEKLFTRWRLALSSRIRKLGWLGQD